MITAGASLALVRLDLRLIRRGAVVLVGLVAGVSAAVVAQYAVTFTSVAEVRALEALAANPAIRVLFGVPRGLDTAGGFTVWRTGMITAVAVAAWALAVGTRLTRGEEDAGRAWLSLAGAVGRPVAMVGVHLVVVGTMSIVLAAVTAAAMVAAGASASGAVVYGAGLAGIGLVFSSVGVASGQLLGERRAATGMAAGLLVVAVLVRMVADGVDRLGWLAWLSPFGLVSLSRPYAGDRWPPVIVLVAMAALVGILAWVVAARRDAGAGVVSPAEHRSPRPVLLRSASHFAVRRGAVAVLGWSTALAAYFLLLGALGATLTAFLEDNPRFVDIAGRAGFDDLATMEGYAASLFLLLPVPLGLFATLRIAHAAEDEVRGSLGLLLARPLGRARWLLGETVAAAVAMLALALVTAVAFWLGSALTGAGLSLPDAMAGTLNVVPVALLALAAAVLGLGWTPDRVTLPGAVPVVGGFVVWVLASTLDWPDWLRQLSPFAHLESVPARAPDLGAAVVMLGIAVLAGAAGVASFTRRDLRG